MVLAMGTAQAQKLTAAGATFPYPIYSKWFSEYSTAHPGVEINYAIDRLRRRDRPGDEGAGGFRRLGHADDRRDAGISPVKLIHIPTVLGAVVPVYNVPGVKRSAVSAGVLSPTSIWARSPTGTTPRSRRTIPDVKLPDQKIIVVHRSDGSGTSFIWTDFLSKVSKEWAGGPGKGTSVSVAGGRWRQRQ